MALGGSGHADTINSDPTRAACFADLRDHAVRLMKRRGRHGMRRCHDGECKDNGYEPDHSFLRCNASRELVLIGQAASGAGVRYPLIERAFTANRSRGAEVHKGKR